MFDQLIGEKTVTGEIGTLCHVDELNSRLDGVGLGGCGETDDRAAGVVGEIIIDNAWRGAAQDELGVMIGCEHACGA